VCRVRISVQVASRVSQFPLRGAAVNNKGQNRPLKHQKMSLTPLLVGFINGIDPERTSSPQFALGFSVVSAPEALAQLEGGDAEHPLQMQRRDRAGIHARSLEYRCEP
jgi:hypothetical protein